MFYNLALAATESTGDKLSIGEAGITAIFGYCVVFFGLIILMAVLYGTGAYFKSKDAKKLPLKRLRLQKRLPKLLLLLLKKRSLLPVQQVM